MRDQRSAGFTLIELVMVIILIGIIAVYAAPRFGALSSYNLTQATSELVEAIRYAQEASMARIDRSYQVVTGGADNYRVSEHDGSAASDIASPLTGSTPFTANAAEWSGIGVTALNLSFDTRGYPCATVSPCSSHMTTALSYTLMAGGETRTITVEAITGFAYVN